MTTAEVLPITGNDEEVFTYATIHGEPTHQKVLTKNPDRAFWRVMDEERGWVEAEPRDGLPAVVFNAPDVAEASTVYVLGDEKSAIAVMRVAPEGTAATCNPVYGEAFGAGMAEAFTGKDVIVWRMRHTESQRWASMIAEELKGYATSVRIVEPCTDGEYDSVIHHLEEGFTLDQAKPVEDRNVTAILLDDLVTYFERFVTFPTGHHAKVLALWVMHSYVYDRDIFDVVPYLWIYSAEKRSGKTLVLDLLALVVKDSWQIVMPSEAVIFRVIHKNPKTILIDEVDCIFSENGNEREGLRALINAGYKRGAVVPRCISNSNDPEDFRVYGCKAFAGIGVENGPETVRDRSILFPMQRQKPSERKERARSRRLRVETEPMRRDLEDWAEQVDFGDEDPPWLESLNDRAADAWQVLLAIADKAGERWGREARITAKAMHSNADGDAEAEGTLLLVDIAAIFAEMDTGSIFSRELLTALNAIETSPWATYKDGRGLTLQRLASMLRPYGVIPSTIRVLEVTAKGYNLDDFRDAFERYPSQNASKS